MLYINAYATISESQATLNGQPISLTDVDANAPFLSQVYRHLHADYPKFFKMDNLCKAGFLAAEMLMDKPQSDEALSDWAILSFSSTSSLHTDINYQHTIASLDNYYPSPSLFVYTLANIMIGEVAIRHHLQGESSSYILPAFDADRMCEVVQIMLMRSPQVSNVLLVWADCIENHIDVSMFLLSSQSQPNALEFNVINLNKLRR